MKRGRGALLTGCLAACALAAAAAVPAAEPAERPVDPDAVTALIRQAEAARRTAAGLGAEWLETGEIIEQARRAADQGNWGQAATLAEQALSQGELAVAQAEREAEAWRARVVR